MQKVCFCGSKNNFEACCQPYILGVKHAPSAEALMRSRYSAYASNAFNYIFQTYAATQRAQLNLNDLKHDAENTHWLKLEVLSARQQTTTAQVKFCAYYQLQNTFYKLHELSDFCLEDGKWCYTQGEIYDDSGAFKPQRNESCLCGSNKKFKKCCGK